MTLIYFESQTKQFSDEFLQVLKSDWEKSPAVRETFKFIESGNEGNEDCWSFYDDKQKEEKEQKFANYISS